MKIKVGVTSFGVMNDYLAHRRHLPVDQQLSKSEIVVKRDKKDGQHNPNQQEKHQKKPQKSYRKGLDILV